MAKGEGLGWTGKTTIQNSIPVANRQSKLTEGDKMYLCPAESGCDQVYSVIRCNYPRPGHYEFEYYPRTLISAFRGCSENIQMENRLCGNCCPTGSDWVYGKKYKKVHINGNG